MASKILMLKSFLSSCCLLLSRLSFSYNFQKYAYLHLGQPHSILADGREVTQSFPEKILVLDLEGDLLKSNSTFPYFMFVALEAGGFLRGLLLLCLYPFLFVLSREKAINVMTVVSFCGLKEEEVIRVGRAVLPKHFLEDVRMEGLDHVIMRCRMQSLVIICVSRMPRVMVERFAKEYVKGPKVVVVGKEVKAVGGYYTGYIEGKLAFDDGEFLRFGLSGIASQHQLISARKEAQYYVCDSEIGVPEVHYPKPVVFHDGRLAFRPTPLAALAMYMWVPLGILLTLFRTLAFIYLPYNLSIPLEAISGTKFRVLFPANENQFDAADAISGRMFVCNHRTVLDPIFISAALKKPVAAVTYSISRITERISPIRTVSLTRKREEDRNRIETMLKQGDLVVCPEGTTCREPYLLRFSPLFAEVANEVHPVALETKVTMFYGTSTGFFKFLDHFYFLMNPSPEYVVKFMGKMSTQSIDGRSCTGVEAANHLQSEIGQVLGFELTKLTRKDKYLQLAGNEGYVM